MILLLERVRRTLTRNGAETRPDERDQRLRGRTYAIPFHEVWNTALRLANGELSGWKILTADDQKGEIRAEATTRVFRFVDDVTIRMGLDRDGQTRVDLRSASRTRRIDFGTNARRIRTFCHALDTALGATPAHIRPPAPPACSDSARPTAGPAPP